MKLSKNSKSVIAIYAILLVVYIVAFMIIPFNKIAASWISFAFTIIAITGSLLVFNIAFNVKGTIVSKIYGYPIFRVGAVYALTQLAIGVVVCIVSAFVAVPYWVPLLISLVLLGAAAIGIIITDNTRDLVEKVDAESKAATKVVTYFQIDIDGILDECEDAELKEKIEALSEQFRFSDPVSSESTKETEEKINSMLSDLRSFVEAKNNDEANALIIKIGNAIKERNRICKATK